MLSFALNLHQNIDRDVESDEEVEEEENAQCIEVDAPALGDNSLNNLRAHYQTQAGAKLLSKSKLSFHRDDLDLVKLHGENIGKIRPMKCKCGDVIGHYHLKYITNNGPTASYGPTTSLGHTKSGGPQRHCGMKYNGNLDGVACCMCGYWYRGKLYKDENLTELVGLKELWKCTGYLIRSELMGMAVNSAHKNCGSGYKEKGKIVMLKKSQTFKARTKQEEE